jgi:copper chaperone NosL
MAVNLQEAYSGRLMNWDQALRVVAEGWGLPAPAGPSAPYGPLADPLPRPLETEPCAPRPPSPPLTRRHLLRLLATAPAALALAPLASCGASGPRAIRIGEEECAHCRMRISEERFAAQLLNDRGRSWVFDSIECMVEWTLQEPELPEDRIRGWWVTDFEAPGKLARRHPGPFLRSDTLRSPMGLGLSAYDGRAAAEAQQGAHGGEVLDWDRGPGPRGHHPVRGGGMHGGMGGAAMGGGAGAPNHAGPDGHGH